jgi:hypothetical protein
MKEMKFAKCVYSRFMNSEFPDLNLRKGDVFAVTPDIAKAKFYVDGLNTKNFIPVEINSYAELRKVVNVTDAMKKAFTDGLVEAKKAQEAKKEATPKAKPKSHPTPKDKGVKKKAKETSDSKFELPDLDKMKYKELQMYAKVLEGKAEKQIDRGLPTEKLKAEIKKVYSEMK